MKAMYSRLLARTTIPGTAASVAALAFAVMATFVLSPLEGHEERLLAITLVAAVALAARSHGCTGALLSTLAVAGISIAATLAGRGPFVSALPRDAVLTLAIFIGLCGGTGWAFCRPRPETSGGHERVLPAAVLMAGLAATMALWHYTAAGTEARKQEHFNAQAGEVVQRIAERMADYEQVLRGARALFDASDDVSEHEWQRYVGSQELVSRYPGVQAFGYARLLEGQGDAPPGSQVVYLEPLSDRNLRALGLDMLKEPVRQHAMENARDSGEPTLSGHVILVQESGEDMQPGSLLYVPVYRHDAPVSTPQQRRAALQGWVYSAFRMHNLMRAIFGGPQLRDLTLSVYDGPQATPSALLYADAGWAASSYRYRTSSTFELPLLGHRWTVLVRTTPAFEATVDTQRAQVVLAGGALISMLLFGVVNGMARTRHEALELAQRMSAARVQAEQRFQSLAESANEGILVLGEGGRVDFCNRMATALFGYTPQQIKSLELGDLLQLPFGFEAWKKGVTRGVPCAAFETHAVTSQGGLVPVEVSLGGWEAQGVSYFSVLLHDISWRQAVSENLRKTRGELRSILENIPAMVGWWDAQLRNRFCNGEYRDWFGVDPQEMQGKHIREVLGEKLYQLNLPYLEKVLQGEPQSFERIITSADGRSRHAQACYIPDIQDGVVQGFFVLVFDISRQKATEQALEYGLKLHDLIFTHAGVGIVCVRNGCFERVSRRCTELLGYAEGELDGQPEHVVYPDPQAYQEMGERARHLLAQGSTLDHELSLRRRDGGLVWCRTIARAIDPADASQGTVWIIEDFSDRKQRETLLQAAREAAEGAARTKAQFLANMSHEIRTPMNAIMGMTRLTLDSPLDDTQRENLQMVEEAASSLLRILDDILDFSKMEAGKLSLANEPFDLREQLASTLQVAASQARVRGLELVLDVAPDVPEFLTGDAGRLMQVVTNLCGNAVKFTERGQVVCRVRRADEAVEGPAATLVFEVIDSGVGIEPEAQSRIFESFVQADSSISRNFGGTGLGLTICAQLVAMMRGRIEVDSTPGRGSCFRFTACFGQASPPPMLTEEEARLCRGARAVLAVANTEARDALARLLGHFGLTVLTQDTALEAIAQARTGGAGTAEAAVVRTVLLVDAGLWSDQATRALRHAPGATVVMLGPVSDPGDEHGQPSMATLRQPVRQALLLRTLCRALGGAAAQAAPAPASLPATQAQAKQPAGQRLRILLAEDHPVNRQIAQRILELRGHEVVTADNGLQAVEAALRERFDVVVMDVQMPVLDGEAATARIRAHEQALDRHTPIVALTAHALVGERERLLALGMDGYLSKPFQPSELVALVERAAAAAPAGLA